MKCRALVLTLILAPACPANPTTWTPCRNTPDPPERGSTSTEVPDEAKKLNHRGLERLTKREYDASVELFRQALKIKPDYADALNNLGKALDALGKDDEAIGEFDQALKLAPENAVIHSNKGLALSHDG